MDVYISDSRDPSTKTRLCTIYQNAKRHGSLWISVSWSWDYTVENCNNNKTYIVQNVEHTYDAATQGTYAGRDRFLYLSTDYSDAVKALIDTAGEYLTVTISTHWAYDGEAVWYDYTLSSQLDSTDNKLIKPARPTITNQEWCVKDNLTNVKLDYASYAKDTNAIVTYIISVGRDGDTTNIPMRQVNSVYYHPTDLQTQQGNRRTHQYEFEELTVSASARYTFRTLHYLTTPTSVSLIDADTVTVTSADTTIYPPSFAQPYEISGEDNQNGSVTLRWSVDSTDASQPYDNSSFVVERSTNEAFTASVKSYTVAFVPGQKTYTVQDTFAQRSQGNVKFYYRVHREHAAVEELNAQSDQTINTNYATLESFSASIDTTQNTVDLQWSYNPGIRCPELVVNISYGTTSLNVPSDSTPEYKGITIPGCQETEFTAQLYARNIQYSNSKSTVITVPPTNPGVIDTLFVSAGFYNDHVNVIWSVDQTKPFFSDFVVVRSEYNSTDPSEQTIATIPFTSGTYSYTYTDNSCVPGVYYEYKVIGMSDCGDTVARMSEKSRIGFAQPYGVVSGQITYNGNQGVENVAVYAECEDQYKGKSLSFRASQKPTLEIPANYVNQLSSATEATFEFYVRVNDKSARNPLLRLGNLMSLENEGNRLTLTAKDAVETTHASSVQGALKEGVFTHVAMTYKTENGRKDVTVYIDGDSATSLSFQQTGTPGALNVPLLFGYDGDSTYMTGYFDEIRIWNTCRSQEAIDRYRTIYLNGEESGLTAYYRCDDNVSRMIFDVSKSNSNYNSRHLAISNITIDENNIPTKEQLGHVTYTDANGNYLFRNLPYSNQGTLYDIIPVLGIHEFSPTMRPLFFNAGAMTHNSIDFNDVSSFPVSGRVTFVNTNYPVVGCQFLIDGTDLCTRDGEAVTTDEDGYYSINVPIGRHYIQIQKNSHTFVNGGRYPADPNGVGTTVEFLEGISMLTFQDSTFMLVTGRVAGGSDEEEKVHGFGQGNANIGQAVITLGTPGDLYNLNTDTANSRTFRMPTERIHGTCNSVATTGPAVLAEAHRITILTDSLTGEFNVMLPPLDYEVKDVDLVNNEESISFDLSSIGNIALSDKETVEVTTDSVLVNGANEEDGGTESYATFSYSAALDVIHHAYPEMSVRQNLDNEALGAPWYVRTEGGVRDTVQLYSVDTTGAVTAYTFGHPCFNTDEIWTWQISAYEPYTNYDDSTNIVTTKQPFRYGVVTVSNSFGEQIKNANSISDTSLYYADASVVTVSGNELLLDSSGTAYYTFRVGEPNILAPYTSYFSIYYEDAGRTRYYDWEGNDDNEVIVLSSKVVGNSFVTQGPDEIFYILRDPVGSESYAEWEAGETVTRNVTHSEDVPRQEEFTTLMSWGNTTYEVEVTNNTTGATGSATSKDDPQTIGLTESYEGNTTNYSSNSWTYTNTTTITTSDDPLMVGSAADVFIGNSTNRLFGNARQVYIAKDTAGNYSIADKTALSVKTEFSTQFNYTQSYIENTLIPDLESLRNQLLTQVQASQYDSSYVNTSDSAMYITTLAATDPQYGKNGTYIMIMPQSWYTDASDSSMYYDEVYGYNNQIRRWEDALAHNERCKVIVHNSAQSFNRQAWESIVYGASSSVFQSVYAPSVDSTYDKLDRLVANYDYGWLVQNYSLSSGTSLSVNETREYSTVGNGFTETDGFMVGVEGDNNAGTNKIGFEFEWEATAGGTWSSESSTENGESSSVTYNIALGSYDALTFDVYQSPDGFGPIFAARGGQTSCPYQDQEVTKYYEPGSEIQAATIPTAEPSITVQNPVVSNIPTGESAFFNIQIANTSTATNALGTFILAQGTMSNPNSALMLVNGHELTQDGTVCYMYGGDVANKTIEVAQSRYDILDYDSIQLIFRTECDYLDADTIYISAHFVETCADIALNADYNIVNNTTGNTVEFTINDFDQQFRNLNGVELQYQRAGDTEWHLVQSFPADSAASINYEFTFSKPAYPDGTYRFRAVSKCQFGTEYVTNESVPVVVIVDMEAPEALGQPYPLDGVYTANSQVYVEFNEAIQTGRVLSDNVEVGGVLNAHPVNHSVSMLLDNTTATSNATYNLGTTPFTLERWVNYSQAGTLFSFANGANTGIEFGIDSTDHFTAKVNGNSYTSAGTLQPDEWMYLIIRCDADSGFLRVSYAYSDQVVTLFANEPIAHCTASGNIRFGGNGIVAKMHEISLWKEIRTVAEALAGQSESKSSYTENLLSLWHAEEGEGFVVADNVRQRNLTLTDDSWAYSNVNYAMQVAAGDTAAVNLTESPIATNKNFVVEFWFRAAGDAVLMSVPDQGFVISISGSNLIVENYTMPISNYTANTWHHLAFFKPSNASPVVAIDGKQLASSRLSTLPTFQMSWLVFGDTSNVNDIQIDEVRVWNLNTTLAAVKLRSKSCLTGTEDGLTAYYPMEAYVTDSVTSQTSVEFSLEDRCKDDACVVSTAKSIIHSDSLNAQATSAPALVESRPTEYVAHTFTVSEDKIYVNITESAPRIEGCTLELTIKDIVDENGNYSEPIRWTVFVNRNQLVWDEDSYIIEKEETADTTIQLTIVNNSSTTQNWSVSGVPSCMTLSESSGRINPLQTKTITCTIDATTNRGENEHTLVLTGNEDMESPLYITTKVYANKPDWVIDPNDYENSMNLVAYAEIDGKVTDDPEDMVAAFVDGELAGVANLELLPAMGRYYIMMTIYHNGSSTGEVTFSYWDASTGKIYSEAQLYRTVNDSTYTPISVLNYQDNLVLGNILRPIRIVMGEEIEQSMDLNGGWNWISFNVEPTSMLFSNILSPYLNDFSIIKSQTGYGIPDTAAATVRGSIGSMDCSKGYKIKANKAFELKLSGFATSLTENITFTAQQWTWFGYLPQRAMTINQALSNINPNVGDFVKSQTQFATWDGYQWVGPLKVMEPGQSYLYQNAGTENITFTYPDYAENVSQLPGRYAVRHVSAGYFEPIDPGKYQGNMSVTAVVKYAGEEVTTAEVGVFAGSECRAAAVYDDGYYFISVPGDSAVQLTVKVMYNDSVYTLSEQLQYQNDAIIGTLDNPYVIDLAPVDPGTSVSVVPADPMSGDKVEKVLINNEVFIIRNGKMYDMWGRPRE